MPARGVPKANEQYSQYRFIKAILQTLHTAAKSMDPLCYAAAADFFEEKVEGMKMR